MRTREEKLAYQRGYSSGAKWPDYRPPMPPEPMAARLMKALRHLRDAIDGELAKFDEDDELNHVLTPFIAEADEAMIEVGRWLKEKNAGS